MQMNRTRIRRDRFDLRGWTYPFNEVRDGATFARLETDTDETQQWELRTGQVVEIRPGDIEAIAPQIGMPIPGKRRSPAAAPTVAVAAPPPPPDPIVEEGEPLPDTLARLVPVSVETLERKTWLLARWQNLTHRIHAPDVFGPLSPAEVREHEELERYRGLFA